MNNIIVPTNNIEGNITNCKIETARVKVDRESPFSFIETKTYKSYDVCTKEIVNEYTIPNITGFGGMIIFTIIIGMIIFTIIIFIRLIIASFAEKD